MRKNELVSTETSIQNLLVIGDIHRIFIDLCFSLDLVFWMPSRSNPTDDIA